MKNKDKGIGDTISRITQATYIDKIAAKIAELRGKSDCGCESRKDTLNKMFPYKNTNGDY